MGKSVLYAATADVNDEFSQLVRGVSSRRTPNGDELLQRTRIDAARKQRNRTSKSRTLHFSHARSARNQARQRHRCGQSVVQKQVLTRLAVGKDKQVCGDAKPDPALIVGNDGGVTNAVVQIAGLKEGRAPVKEAELDQVKREYVPHVLVVVSGGTVTIKNSDGILHNVHTVSKENKPFNRAQPKFLKEIKETFSKPEMVAVRCDVHGWMSGWIVVTDNVFHEISQADGAFKLADVPAGKHTIEVWHEKLGKVSREVEVKPGETVDVAFELQAKN